MHFAETISIRPVSSLVDIDHEVAAMVLLNIAFVHVVANSSGGAHAQDTVEVTASLTSFSLAPDQSAHREIRANFLSRWSDSFADPLAWKSCGARQRTSPRIEGRLENHDHERQETEKNDDAKTAGPR